MNKLQFSFILIGTVIASVPPCPTATALMVTEVPGQVNPGPGAVLQGRASWYSTEACQYNPDPKCPTSDGSSLYELQKRKEFYAASYYFKLGSHVRVWYKGRSIVVTIRDRGPNKRLHRLIDLSREAFKTLAPLEKGIIEVKCRKEEK